MHVLRKQHGHFLDDFRPGQVFRHKRGKTITEGLFAVFTDFSMTTNPLSKNARYARAFGFRDMVVPPGLVMAVVFSQSVEDVSENARANLEYIDMRFGVPVYTGDTLEAETTVLSVRASTRDPSLGVVLEHSRGRVVTTDHILLTGMLDNTSQVHCNQWMVDQQPERYVGGQLIVFGGIPFNLCLGLSSADVADNSLADLRYATGRHTAPVFAGDTVFASTEIRALQDLQGRPDLGVLPVVLRGHKFGGKGTSAENVEIFYLERELVVKRRSHYT